MPPFFSSAFAALSEHKLEVLGPNAAKTDGAPVNVSYIEEHPDQENIILFLHANAVGKDFFAPIINQAVLAPFRLIAVSVPGFQSVHDFAKTIHQFIVQLGVDIERVTVFGWLIDEQLAKLLLQKNKNNKQFAQIILTDASFKNLTQREETITSYPSRFFVLHGDKVDERELESSGPVITRNAPERVGRFLAEMGWLMIARLSYQNSARALNLPQGEADALLLQDSHISKQALDSVMALGGSIATITEIKKMMSKVDQRNWHP